MEEKCKHTRPPCRKERGAGGEEGREGGRNFRIEEVLTSWDPTNTDPR